MNLYDPSRWADVSGLWTLIAVLIGTLVLVGAKLVGPRWDNWPSRGA